MAADPGDGPIVATKALDPYTDSSGASQAPELVAGMAFKDVGSYGLRQYGGWVREEFNSKLQGREAQRYYREMLDNSATVGGILFAVMQTMRKVEWRQEPADDTPAAEELAEFAGTLRDDMSHTWEDFVAEALTMLPFGFAPHEIVYKRRSGRKRPNAKVATSKYDDSRIGLRRLPLRGQETILKWFFDQNGQTTGLTQQPWMGQLIDLPIEKLLLFRPTAHKNNPEGRSILRNSARIYHFMKRMEEQEAVLFERFSGLPVLWVPPQLLDAVAANDPKAIATYDSYKQLVRNVRIDEQMGVILPSGTFAGPQGPTNVRMYDFKLITPEGGSSHINANDALQRYKVEMLTTVLADFLDLGHQARGTQNLAISKVDMFFQAIAGWMQAMSGVLNQYLLPRIWDLNALDFDLMPQYVPDLAQRIDLDMLSNFILRISQAGMPMFPDADLENWVRDAAGMPDITEEADFLDQTQEPRQAEGEPPVDVPNDVAKMLVRLAARRTLRARKRSTPAYRLRYSATLDRRFAA